MSGTTANPEGITSPAIDNLLEKVDSKYTLAVFGAARARQINSYRQELKSGDGNITSIGPLVQSSPEDKPLSVALQEVADDKLKFTRE
ncbi:DNA-directed RNA polymerase subunit omega [Arcanobacterium haemolyticum]|uniref:DNA-directed RNA polymerase subunit omega n=1 Tax=Arcanobacterium haemolyticum (strain ATCC 9345 / DSM 20595 / CCM 5947 / CCUG 17215 / LMG 16163 / NBRC 15585 / NCTC 8452 / 11018) TaxID=644284 RepID=D7BNT1_ARCHD|nr:DNA-directed RNA polymerase subunit omega [Arcanobacterium haemolyticum]ADH92580.1 DNA-directed RNA polymerase, omega subunit [Arcanobacterium haemolyticum DSM 20595]QCX46698.1 DNA-directed RNA polymerase subunit omega [Arcanobacterium haemolyticum]SPT74443.1 DNA-directed RNA polymerase subunit omega [Arcanobacterium haemolyticum]SQH28686.1 DNA-directed RNA polymerase subunit omega [Arcanobacterium haemolyticum]